MKKTDGTWKQKWDARLTELRRIFGPEEEGILTAMPPIYLGGNCDVLTFRQHLKGFVYVTAGLTGEQIQPPTELGEYELMMCSREQNEWMPNLISRLAQYTTQTPLGPGETMDIGPALPEPTTLSALLFLPYSEFEFLHQKAGVLLCLGITQVELDFCRKDGVEELVRELKEKAVYPFTDPQRPSCIPH